MRPVDLNPHIDRSRPYGPPEEIAKSLALPVGLEFGQDGKRIYLCAMGSDAVGVLDPDGKVLDRIPVGRGPTGLALDEGRRRLYVLDAIEAAISVVDLDERREVGRVPLRYDPEPPAVRAGRPFLYGARTLSGHGDSACASCHIFADTDGLAWDLGDPGGKVAENVLPRPPEFADRPPIPFHPLKGPMLTPSLRGLEGAGAQHWRGDNNGGKDRPFDERLAFLASRPAFRTLLGREKDIPPEDMEKMWGFVRALRYPPNPVANLDGTLTAAQSRGKRIFESDGNPNGLGGSGTSCVACHVPPFGTGGRSVPAAEQDFKVPHLRNLYARVGMFGYAVPNLVSIFPYSIDPTPTAHLGDQVRGFGFTNDGSVPTLFDFFLRPLGLFAFKDEPGWSGRDKVRDLEAFLLAFPTGLAPIVGQQVTLAAGSPPAAYDRLGLLVSRAEAGDGDLVVTGIVDGVDRGFLLTAGDGGASLQSDREGDRRLLGELLAAIRGRRAILTALVAPPGNGRRIGLDRDEDGALDRDEIDAGTDPADPASRPGRAVPAGPRPPGR